MKSAPQIIFLGGFFLPEQIELILNSSKGPVQNAADTFQKAIVRGLSQARPESITAVNLPFTNMYPTTFRLPFFPGIRTRFESAQVYGIGFCVVRFVRSFSRMASSFGGLTRHTSQHDIVVIYSAHLPFMIAASALRVVRPLKVVLILPDLPEFTGEGGLLYRLVKFIEAKLFYALAKRIDGFVVLTRFMAERLSLDSADFIVVEGIAEDARLPPTIRPSREAILYTGTLAARYGILDLLDAFRQMSNKNVELWIAGEGDSAELIRDAAKKDPRIKYFGQITRAEAQLKQAHASILVNPRPSEGEYTRYSFPSKTMEYMASGRPVVMHRLPGIPDEYSEYFISPKSPGAEGLAAALDSVVSMSHEAKTSFGHAARDFVLTHKSENGQGLKIANFLLKAAAPRP